MTLDQTASMSPVLRPYRRRVTTALRSWVFVAVSTAIMVVTSEKFYWYPQGFPGLDHLELMAFYAVGVLAFLAMIRRYSVRSLPGVVLGSAVFSLVVEGAVTPVMYEDGPLPVLALYFFGWHGLLSVVVAWYGIRRLALAGRLRQLAALSVGVGLLVGAWSTTYWRRSQIAEMLSDREADWDPGRWSVGKFAVYVSLMTAVLIVGHRILDVVWPTDWRIGRTSERMVLSLVVLGVGVWTLVLPWAAIKFAVCAWIVHRLLSGSWGRPETVERPTVFESLVGRVSLRDLSPVTLIVPSAVGVYAAIGALGPSDVVLDIVYGTIVGATLVAGASGLVVAARRYRVDEVTSGSR